MALVDLDLDITFKAPRRVTASGITVASMNKGVVLLSGKTKSLEAYFESVEVANAVRGHGPEHVGARLLT